MSQLPQLTAMTSWPVRLALLFISIALLAGTMLPFWPVWLRDQQIGALEIGLMLGVMSWAKIPADIFWAEMSDRTNNTKKMLLILSTLTTLSMLIFYVSDIPYYIWIGTIILGVTMRSIMPLGDALTLQSLDMMEKSGKTVSYGRVRLWGSIAFIVASFIVGAVIDLSGSDWILHFCLIFAVLGIFSALSLPNLRCEKQATTSDNATGAILKHKGYLLFLIVVTLLQASHGVYYAISALYWKSIGYSELLIGVLWAEGVIAEIILFFWATPIVKRLGWSVLLLLAALAGIIRWSFLASIDDITITIIVQALHGLTFGATHIASQAFIRRHAPLGGATRLQGLTSSTSMGIGTGLTLMIAGWLYQDWHQQSYWLMTLLCLVALFLLYGLDRYWRDTPRVPKAPTLKRRFLKYPSISR